MLRSLSLSSWALAAAGTLALTSLASAAPPPAPAPPAAAAAVPAPVPPVTAAPPAPTPAPSAANVPVGPQSDADLIRNGQGSLVFAEGQKGAGSGFICLMGGAKYIFTNAHVLAGNAHVVLTLLDGAAVQIGSAGAAIGHDMVRIAVGPTPPAFSMVENVNDGVLVGDEVLVLGNAKGARVINPISGRVVGIGPNLVEVDAPFQHGNSGSPIIQKRTGRVIAIATFATEDTGNLEDAPRRATATTTRKRASTAKPPPVKLRRFGYRLDTAKLWQPIVWPEFQAEAAALEKVDERTQSMVALIRAVNERGGVMPGSEAHADPVAQLLHNFEVASATHPSATDASKAKQDLLGGLCFLSTADISALRPKLHYDYFLHELAQRQPMRDAMTKAFEEALHAQMIQGGN